MPAKDTVCIAEHHVHIVVRRFDAVIHFAGRKAVGESVQFPMLYYTHNVAGTVNLIEAMRKHNVRNVSSTSIAYCLLLPERRVGEVLPYM